VENGLAGRYLKTDHNPLLMFSMMEFVYHLFCRSTMFW